MTFSSLSLHLFPLVQSHLHLKLSNILLSLKLLNLWKKMWLNSQILSNPALRRKLIVASLDIPTANVKHTRDDGIVHVSNQRDGNKQLKETDEKRAVL